MNLTGYSATQLYYRPQTKFAKVMFLHLPVGHSVHRGVCITGRGILHPGLGVGGVVLHP